MDDDFVRETCRPGQGGKCCKYLIMSSKGWGCAKLTDVRATIDARTDMVAKGDNCDGIKMEES